MYTIGLFKLFSPSINQSSFTPSPFGVKNLEKPIIRNVSVAIPQPSISLTLTVCFPGKIFSKNGLVWYAPSSNWYA